MSASIRHIRTSYKSKARFRNNILMPPEYYRAIPSVKYYLRKGKELETAFDIVSSKRNLEKAKLRSYFYSNHSINDIKRLQGLPVTQTHRANKKRKRKNARAQYYANKKKLLS